MKKLSIILTVLTALSLCGCNNTSTNDNTILTEDTTVTKIESSAYFASGRYYFTADLQGQVVTEDGNLWDYTQDTISDKPSYHNEPVIVVFDDNSTPDIIEDDKILGLVYDRETAIYDALETSLQESFELERDGNTIHIQALKTVE